MTVASDHLMQRGSCAFVDGADPRPRTEVVAVKTIYDIYGAGKRASLMGSSALQL